MDVRSILAISAVKTLYYSARFRGQILVVRGTRVRLARGARIELAPGARLYLGHRHPLGTPLSLRIRANGRLIIHGEAKISSGSRVLISEDAKFEIDDQTFIHYDAIITCWNHITIGRSCGISWNVNILDGSAHELTAAGKTTPATRSVHIGNGAWIATGATIVGASIGDGAMVGAASMVSSNVPPKVLVKGNPAQITREDVSFESHTFAPR